MYIFLDESGDLGFDFNKKPSTHFVVTLLVCHDHSSIVRFKAAVKHTLVNKLNAKEKRRRLVTELKGERTAFTVKEYFYKRLANNIDKNGWQLYCVILDKKALLNRSWSKSIPFNIHRLYNMLSHLVLSQIDFSNVKSSVQLSVDCSKAPKERKVFNQYLQGNLEVQLPIDVTLNITHELSNNNAGLQVVDMFCWGIFRKYTLNDARWYNLFKGQIAWEEIADF